MCPRPRERIVLGTLNVPDETHTIQLELRFDGAAPTGFARLVDGDPSPFSGWVGLVRAVEELVSETPPVRTAT